jgi:hypothetical protein
MEIALQAVEEQDGGPVFGQFGIEIPVLGDRHGALFAGEFSFTGSVGKTRKPDGEEVRRFDWRDPASTR